MSSAAATVTINAPCFSRFILSVAVVLTLTAYSGYCKNASELVQHLIDSYPRYIRPVKNDSFPVVIKHRMTPRQIIEMDENSQIIVLKGWLSEIWTDHYMQWDPTQYENIEEVRIPSDKIWLPDIVLVDSVKRDYERHFKTDAIINSDGEVVCMAPIVFEASCPIDPTNFPFDEQHCVLTFMSWSYNGKLLDLTIDPATNVDSFRANSEWHLANITVTKDWMQPPCCPEPYPLITYTLHLKRRSLFYIFNLIFPSFLACILVAVGFILPSDSGERMTLCITSALVEFVFLETVSAYMPPNSENLPTIQKYLLVSIGFVVFSLMMTAMTLNLHFKGPQCGPVPPWLRVLAFKYIAAIVCTKPQLLRARLVSSERNGMKRKNAVKAVKFGLPGLQAHQYGSVPGHHQAHGMWLVGERDGDSDNEEDMAPYYLQEWREVAKLIDRFYFLIYLLVTLFLMVSFMAAIVLEGTGNTD
ncbi:neuronal acetylcholine receptor subunit alpha-10-like [Ptychodera flava]|uniref:neuronal acetylcholine receptor subunit alpha-10-like n=1 Tax=Ptychodera flava TaxID=63121 RepID=UPI00396A691F